jgi:hypothetical protein
LSIYGTQASVAPKNDCRLDLFTGPVFDYIEAIAASISTDRHLEKEKI